MTLWLIFAVMTGAAVLAVLWPLRTGAALAGADERQADLAVYRDQLDEIERDRSAGLIGAREGEAARTEIARRMLRAADEGRGTVATASDRRRRIAAVVALVGVPAIAGGLYVGLGSPDLPGQPLSARLSADPATADIAVLVRRVESHLEANPDDGRGYEVVAPIYYRVGRLEDAVRAWETAIRLLGPSAPRETGLGEAETALAGGVVTADAQKAFERALALDPTSVKANYYLGLGAAQDGRRQDAIDRWSRLVAGAPADAPWLPMVKAALDRLASTDAEAPAGQPPAATPPAGAPPAAAGASAPPAPGPDAADVANAAAMTPEQRAAMVRGMVERLATRLQANGDDLEGWLRLVRAWNVLGEPEKAKAAAGDARRAFTADPAATQRIDALTQELGLGS
ncbi:c-type cytochrome biogenesis protein CcmI [Ancylobacter lacus]|uniref:c-type cytochrome biogenesis protein CcmI n=1 Tax=Ancylobacter lacus TaxID=2579970 RepID=UPI001BD0110A|nr:c-type cytochrome biogenesis protein CcmI [Ancylobacter lacus]MBS7539402.1 c-type cytochrome biogenesis protein CcmI [Ancylobacter lacus]